MALRSGSEQSNPVLQLPCRQTCPVYATLFVKKYPQLVDGLDAMKPLYYRSVSSKGAGRPRLTHHHKGGWNETKLMRWVWRNGGMKFIAGEKQRNAAKNLPIIRIIHHETPYYSTRTSVALALSIGRCSRIREGQNVWKQDTVKEGSNTWCGITCCHI